jgi:hypothetical protein
MTFLCQEPKLGLVVVASLFTITKPSVGWPLIAALGAMKLIHVIYELYDRDASYLADHRDDDIHPLAREIRLCFEDHQAIWIS